LAAVLAMLALGGLSLAGYWAVAARRTR